MCGVATHKQKKQKHWYLSRVREVYSMIGLGSLRKTWIIFGMLEHVS